MQCNSTFHHLRMLLVPAHISSYPPSITSLTNCLILYTSINSAMGQSICDISASNAMNRMCSINPLKATVANMHQFLMLTENCGIESVNCLRQMETYVRAVHYIYALS